MGQTISFPHMQLSSRKTERLLRLHNRETTTSHNSNNNSATFARRSSMGGRLRSYGVILYQPATPTTSTETHGPVSEEDVTAVSTPSPVVNDMISVGKRQWSATSSKASSSSVTTLTTHERSVASMKTLSVSSSSATTNVTPRRRIDPTATSTSSSVSAHASSSSGFSDVVVPVPPTSRLTHDRITLEPSAASSTTSSANTMVVRSRGNGSKQVMAQPQPQHSRLPKLRLGELEQIFAAIVTSDDSSTRAKIALSS